ncbi:MAG: hypothetical protein ACPG4T_03825 [Nannocystaceae bacterium]
MAAANNRLDRTNIVPAIEAWAYLCGHAGPLRETLGSALTWLRICWANGLDVLPFDLVHDLGQMLLGGRGFAFASARDLATWSDDERTWRMDYEDRLLGRWVLDPSVTEAHVAIAGLPPSLRDEAVAHAIGLAIGPSLRVSETLPAGNPAHLRSLAPHLEQLAENLPTTTGDWALRIDRDWVDWALELRAHAIGLLPDKRLFEPEDLWELGHLQELPNESDRLALREIHSAVAAIGPVPPSVGLQVRRRAQEVPVEADEADHYPAGGFDGLSTKGRFENLARTEVVYVGEGSDGEHGVDIFDVRYAEGELLFYTRDQSPLLDQHRELNLVIDQPAQLRFKDPALPAQTLTLVDALCLRLQADLVSVFGPNGATVSIWWRADASEDVAAADEEAGLFALTLAAEIAHRRVALDKVSSLAQLPARGLAVFSPNSVDVECGAKAWVGVGASKWRLDDESYAIGKPGGLRRLANRLMVTLLN